MAKVCLIHPAEGLPTKSAATLTPSLPIGVAYVASSLEGAGHEVQIIDAVGERIDQIFEWSDVSWLGLNNEEVAALIRPDTEVIGVSNMFTHNWPMVRELFRLLKTRFPNARLITGGETASSVTELVLRDSPVEVCVIGEGEETAVELVAALAEGRSYEAIPGLAYRGPDGKIVRSGPRRRIRGLDDIPWPAWDKFNIKGYNAKSYGHGLQFNEYPPVIPILATRGCPYQCTFCTSPQMWTTAYVTRDPKKVVDEIESYMEKYGARNFPFQDLTAITKRDWIIAFCQEVLRRNLKFHWQLPTGTRSEAVDDEVASLLKQTGLIYMGYAPESGSDRVRALVKKRVKAEAFYNSVKSARKANLQVQAFFVIGFPEETFVDLLKTIGMVARLAYLGVEDIAAQHYTPYPGTEMYDKLLAAGKVGWEDKWLLAPIHTHGIVASKKLRVNENYPGWVQTVMRFGAYATFYSISMIRRPIFFLKMLTGIFRNPGHDVSRLQRALKMIFATKPRY